MRFLQLVKPEPDLPDTFVSELLAASDAAASVPDLLENELHSRRQKLEAFHDRKTILEHEISERTEELRQVNLLIADGNRSVADLTAGNRIAAE